MTLEVVLAILNLSPCLAKYDIQRCGTQYFATRHGLRFKMANTTSRVVHNHTARQMMDNSASVVVVVVKTLLQQNPPVLN